MLSNHGSTAGRASRSGVWVELSGSGALLPLLVAERSARLEAEASLERALHVTPRRTVGADDWVRRALGRSLISVGLRLGGAGRSASATASA